MHTHTSFENAHMSQQKKNRVSNWLFNRTLFTRFYERKAGRFSAEFFWDDVCARFLDRIPENATLLEIGSGPGFMAAKILEHRPDLHLIVTDYSPKMLDLARINVGKVAPGKAIFALTNAMDLAAFATHTIDGIYCLGSIKHFPNPVTALLQAKEILADGGIMYFADSCSDGMSKGIKKIIKQIKLPLILSFFLGPIIYFGFKRESPSTTEVKSWKNAFEWFGILDIQFFLDNSIFTLTYKKRYSCSPDDDIPAKIGDTIE